MSYYYQVPKRPRGMVGTKVLRDRLSADDIARSIRRNGRYTAYVIPYRYGFAVIRKKK